MWFGSTVTTFNFYKEPIWSTLAKSHCREGDAQHIDTHATTHQITRMTLHADMLLIWRNHRYFWSQNFWLCKQIKLLPHSIGTLFVTSYCFSYAENIWCKAFRSLFHFPCFSYSYWLAFASDLRYIMHYVMQVLFYYLPDVFPFSQNAILIRRYEIFNDL